MEDKKKVNVAFILDKSGSMGSVRGATVEGFNSYISKLREDSGIDYRFSLTLFDTEITRKYSNERLEDVRKLDSDSYHPDGGTALYDAVCETLLKMKTEGRKTLVVIMTDGEENSSKKFDESKFRDFVRVLKNTGIVSFVFLGANQDAWGNAQKWGFEKQNVAFYNSTTVGTARAMNMTASNTSAFMNSANTITDSFFSKDDQQNLNDAK